MINQKANRRTKSVTILAVIILLIPVLLWSRWIYIFQSNPDLSQGAKVSLFNSVFPPFVRQNYPAFVLVPAVIALLLGIFNLKSAGGGWKILNMVTILLALVIIFFQVFTML